MAVKYIPEGYHTVTHMLIVNNAAGLIQFATQAFGAVLRLCWNLHYYRYRFLCERTWAGNHSQWRIRRGFSISDNLTL